MKYHIQGETRFISPTVSIEVEYRVYPGSKSFDSRYPDDPDFHEICSVTLVVDGVCVDLTSSYEEVARSLKDVETPQPNE
jgi:hypothetical protein